MKHISLISRRPAPAQFEAISQLIFVLSAALGLLNQFADTFGIALPNKQGTG